MIVQIQGPWDVESVPLDPWRVVSKRRLQCQDAPPPLLCWRSQLNWYSDPNLPAAMPKSASRSRGKPLVRSLGFSEMQGHRQRPGSICPLKRVFPYPPPSTMATKRTATKSHNWNLCTAFVFYHKPGRRAIGYSRNDRACQEQESSVAGEALAG